MPKISTFKKTTDSWFSLEHIRNNVFSFSFGIYEHSIYHFEKKKIRIELDIIRKFKMTNMY